GIRDRNVTGVQTCALPISGVRRVGDVPNPNYVDWTFAKTTGARLVPPGPDVTPEYASEVVEEIRALSRRAVEPVAATSQLTAPEIGRAACRGSVSRWRGAG